MALLDLDHFRQTPLVTAPFKHLVVPNFLTPASAAQLQADFPPINHPGLLPLEATPLGPAFAALIAELTGPALTAAVSEKFGLDLSGHPIMVTLRGRCQPKDGRIHTDSAAKLVTALLYFNAGWEAASGRLRLLRSATDLQDIIVEIPPTLGTLVAFRRAENSFHGHEPYSGIRRYVMINWMSSSLSAQRELLRHKLSAQAKTILHYA